MELGGIGIGIGIDIMELTPCLIIIMSNIQSQLYICMQRYSISLMINYRRFVLLIMLWKSQYQILRKQIILQFITFYHIL